MSYPRIAIVFGPVAGWAVWDGGDVYSGTRDLRSETGASAIVVTQVQGWLEELAREQRTFDVIGLLETPESRSLTCRSWIDRWVAESRAVRVDLKAKDVKRVSVGPYGTVGQVVEWAREWCPVDEVQKYEQAAAIAGALVLAACEVPARNPVARPESIVEQVGPVLHRRSYRGLQKARIRAARFAPPRTQSEGSGGEAR